MPDLTIRLPAVPRSVPQARQAIDRLVGELDPQQLEALRLLVSEMVTNSVRHGEGAETVDVRLWLGRGVVRLEVEDRGPGFMPRGVPGEGGGWGLVLVDRLARRWGVRSGPATTVWLELDRYASTV